MIERLKADRGFAGLLTKNPLHPHWQNEFWTEYEYTLDELAEYLDLKGHPLRGSETSGLGRNCELFDNTRQWAYRAIREYWAPNYKRKWNAAVYDKVESTNSQFNVPLPVSEVKAIAKSIANWTYREFTPDKFRHSQAKKGAKGGKVSKRKPVQGSEAQVKPWEALGISRAWYYKKKKLGEIKKVDWISLIR